MWKAVQAGRYQAGSTRTNNAIEVQLTSILQPSICVDTNQIAEVQAGLTGEYSRSLK